MWKRKLINYRNEILIEAIFGMPTLLKPFLFNNLSLSKTEQIRKKPFEKIIKLKWKFNFKNTKEL